MLIASNELLGDSIGKPNNHFDGNITAALTRQSYAFEGSGEGVYNEVEGRGTERGMCVAVQYMCWSAV